jgi:hypothetical protein
MQSKTHQISFAVKVLRYWGLGFAAGVGFAGCGYAPSVRGKSLTCRELQLTVWVYDPSTQVRDLTSICRYGKSETCRAPKGRSHRREANAGGKVKPEMVHDFEASPSDCCPTPLRRRMYGLECVS